MLGRLVPIPHDAGAHGPGPARHSQHRGEAQPSSLRRVEIRKAPDLRNVQGQRRGVGLSTGLRVRERHSQGVPRLELALRAALCRHGMPGEPQTLRQPRPEDRAVLPDAQHAVDGQVALP